MSLCEAALACYGPDSGAVSREGERGAVGTCGAARDESWLRQALLWDEQAQLHRAHRRSRRRERPLSSTDLTARWRELRTSVKGCLLAAETVELEVLRSAGSRQPPGPERTELKRVTVLRTAAVHEMR